MKNDYSFVRKTPKACLNVNYAVAIGEFGYSPEELYENLLLPSFEYTINLGLKLIVQFDEMRPSLDYLYSTLGRLVQKFGVETCRKNTTFHAFYKRADEMIEDEIFSKFTKIN